MKKFLQEMKEETTSWWFTAILRGFCYGGIYNLLIHYHYMERLPLGLYLTAIVLTEIVGRQVNKRVDEWMKIQKLKRTVSKEIRRLEKHLGKKEKDKK